MQKAKMPNNWKLGTLGEVIEGKPQYGLTAQSSQKENKILYLRISDITEEGELKTEDFHYINKDPDEVSKYILQENDLLIARSGSVGRVYLHRDLHKPSVFASYLIRFKLDSRKVLPRFAFYWGLSPIFKKQIEVKKKIVAQPNINAKDYCSFELPLPPLPVQQEIVVTLEKAQRAKQKRVQTNQLTERISQSIFLKMFGDPLLPSHDYPVAGITEISEINPTKSEISNLSDDLEITFLPMAAVSNEGRILERETKKLAEVRKGFTYFREGDVLFAKITPCMENGKGAIARGLRNGIGFGSTEFHVFRPSKEIASEWLFFLLALPSIRSIAKERMTGTAGQKRVPKAFFDQLRVPVPSKDLQDKFAKLTLTIEAMIYKQMQCTQEISQLFHSIMHKAFRGELTQGESEISKPNKPLMQGSLNPQ
jgi:type I restriction enzyme S subunit